jgi:hypothetical protein
MTELKSGSKLEHKLKPPDPWINAGIGPMTITNVIKDMVKNRQIIDKEEETTRFYHLGIDPEPAQNMPVTIISSPLNHNYHVHFVTFVHQQYGTGARILRNPPAPTSQLHLLRKKHPM